MSESDYRQLVERVTQNVASPTIPTDTGWKRRRWQGTAQKEIEWAIAGDIAMHFYGSPRLSRDA